MRLTDLQIKAINETFYTHFLSTDKIWLFGSRADDLKKGGDIDLYIETTCDTLLEAIEKKSIF